MHPAALLAGATGLVGSRLLAELLSSSGYEKVFAVSRRPVAQHHPCLQVLNGELGELKSVPAVSHVFCALGSTIRKAGSRERFREIDYGLPLHLATLALEAGAQSFLLVSSVDADPHSRNFYLRVKGDLERSLAVLPFRSQHFFQPSILLGTRAETRLAEQAGQILARNFGFILQGGLRRYRAMPAGTLAKAMCAAALLDAPGVHVHRYDSILRLARG